MWDISRFALDFFRENDIPFWNMSNANARMSDDNWALADPSGDTLVVYLKDGTASEVDLSTGDDGVTYIVQWFNPRSGGRLSFGSTMLVEGKKGQSLGTPPVDGDQKDADWVVLLTKCSGCALSASANATFPRAEDLTAETGSGDEESQTVIIGLVIALAVTIILLLVFCWRLWSIKRNHDKQSFSLPTTSNMSPSSTSGPSSDQMEGDGEFSDTFDARESQFVEVRARPVGRNDADQLSFKDQSRLHYNERQLNNIPEVPAHNIRRISA